MQLFEGGNVFKDDQGQTLTRRILQPEISPTVQWLETVTGQDFSKDLARDGLPSRWLGSTGRKADSGDLDLLVDANAVSKEDLVKRLQAWSRQQGVDANRYIKKSGTAVHFLTAIGGDPKNGFVQTDFMFSNKPGWTQFVLSNDPTSRYKGALRNIMINSMAKSMGYKLNQNDGIADRATNKVITDDPDAIARILLNPTASAKDLYSVESIMKALKMDPGKDDKIADFRAHMEREGLPFDENLEENEVHFLARLRDRLVNQGMQPIMEAVHIEHPEDMVFDLGSQGIDRALQVMQAAEKSPQAVTVKWDGKPAVIFGRKPSGEFVLTDKAGFNAKGYDGLATSEQQMARILNQRGGDRGELIDKYNKLFPLLRAAVPQNFRGYIQGDLMFTQQPKEINGSYVFQPNTVQYSVPANSSLGQQIANSEVALVTHTMIDQPGGTARPMARADLNPVPGLLILDAGIADKPTVTLDPALVKNLRQLRTKYGRDIDRLFDPQELRARKISDFPALCKQYINHRVRQGNFDNLIAGFGQWLETKTPTKYQRIFQWVAENKKGMAALFQAFVDLSTLKMSLVRQLDAQNQTVQASVNNEPGHEGYVAPGAKFVDRMRFSRANFARNNPETA